MIIMHYSTLNLEPFLMHELFHHVKNNYFNMSIVMILAKNENTHMSLIFLQMQLFSCIIAHCGLEKKCTMQMEITIQIN